MLSIFLPFPSNRNPPPARARARPPAPGVPLSAPVTRTSDQTDDDGWWAPREVPVHGENCGACKAEAAIDHSHAGVLHGFDVDGRQGVQLLLHRQAQPHTFSRLIMSCSPARFQLTLGRKHRTAMDGGRPAKHRLIPTHCEEQSARDSHGRRGRPTGVL